MTSEEWSDRDELERANQSLCEAAVDRERRVARLSRSTKTIAVALVVNIVAILVLLSINFSWQQLSSRQQDQNVALFNQLKNEELHVRSLTAECERLQDQKNAYRHVMLISVGWYRILEALGFDPFPLAIRNSWGERLDR